LLSPHPIYHETCQLYAKAELQLFFPDKHPKQLRASCSFSHPGLPHPIWNAFLHGVIAPSATMEGLPYINSRTVSGLVAKALSTKATDVYPDLFLWALITDVPDVSTFNCERLKETS